MVNLFVIVIFSLLNAHATLDKGGHFMLIDYSISEPAKSEGVLYVDILFHYKGEAYRVARHRYPEPITSIVDTFPWVSKDKWEGGDLEVVARKVSGNIERSYISEGTIEVRNLGYSEPEEEYRVNYGLVKPDNGPDPYAWRMLGYDPGHTGYYPFKLYPPLDSLWLYDWSGAGTWTAEISGAAGQGMIFIPEAPWGWNIIQARDIETGRVIWERYVTANAMTSALSEGDSILFVGSVIGFTPWKDTTFYAFDPFTGKLKWGKIFKTVQESPIVVDSFVFVPSFGLSRIFCVTYGGDTLWSRWAGLPSPVYADGKVFHTAPDSVINARDWLTGELIWDYTGSWDIFNLVLYQRKLVVCPNGYLYALDINDGDLLWQSIPFGNLRGSASYSRLYFAYSHYIHDTLKTLFINIDVNTEEQIWDTLLTPADTNGGRTGFPLISEDSIIWITNCSNVYVFKNRNPIYTINLPQSPAIWPSWNFPIFYKNYFIYAHEDFLVVYEADTVDTTSGDTLNHGFSILYLINGTPICYFSTQRRGELRLNLYSIDGRRVWSLKNPDLPSGRHTINLPELSHTGVYILKYETPDERGVKKFVYIKKQEVEL